MVPLSFQERSDDLNTVHAALTEATFDDYKAKVLLFLDDYPYCYEYWKKLAAASLQHRNMDEALLVYQKAIDTAPYCWQLWAGYIDFAKQCGATSAYSHAFTPDVISQLYQLALNEYVGETYMSTTLWKDYLQLSIDQVLTSSKPNQETVNAILDTYTYIFTGASKSNPSVTGVILRASADTLLALYEHHINLIIKKFPSIGDINRLLSKAKDDFKQCYSTETATRRLSLYACVEKRPFYHNSPFKPELLARFRKLYRVLMDELITFNGTGWVSMEIQSILCICCDYADFWILYIRTLTQTQLYNEALDACNVALSRCHGGISKDTLSAFYIEKLQILELQKDVSALEGLIVCLSNEFSRDPLIVLALAKHYYRQKKYKNCIDAIHQYVRTNCCSSASMLRSFCRLMNAAALASYKETASDQASEHDISKLDDIYTDSLKNSTLTRDGVKMLVVEWMELAQMLREIGNMQYFIHIRDRVYQDYSEDIDVLEVALHTHIQWLQTHGQLTEIIETEGLLLRTTPNHLYSYVDSTIKSASSDPAKSKL